MRRSARECRSRGLARTPRRLLRRQQRRLARPLAWHAVRRRRCAREHRLCAREVFSEVLAQPGAPRRRLRRFRPQQRQQPRGRFAQRGDQQQVGRARRSLLAEEDGLLHRALQGRHAARPAAIGALRVARQQRVHVAAAEQAVAGHGVARALKGGQDRVVAARRRCGRRHERVDRGQVRVRCARRGGGGADEGRGGRGERLDAKRHARRVLRCGRGVLVKHLRRA